MKYFTPELYLRFNSSDEKEADLAEVAWDNAIQSYKRRLKDNRSKMPPNVRTLAEKSCFHDAVVLGWQTHQQGNTRRAETPKFVAIFLQQGNEAIVLHYFLWALPKESKRRKNWPFSQDHKHWLYDEVDIADNVVHADPCYDFVHRILWSDGSELEIPFADVIINRFPLLSPVTA
jgi:hypothetical protein